MVTVQVLSRTLFGGCASRTVDALETEPGERGDSDGGLSELVLLSCRRCEVHCAGLRRAAEGDVLEFGDISIDPPSSRVGFVGTGVHRLSTELMARWW